MTSTHQASTTLYSPKENAKSRLTYIITFLKRGF